jgi:RND family efflux transporter MFP subunit
MKRQIGLKTPAGILFVAGTVLALAGSLFLAGCGKTAATPSQGKQAAKGSPRAVKTSVARDQVLERKIIALGSVVAYDQATLSTKVSGRIESMLVDVGSKVTSGQLLAKIEAKDYTMRLKQAEATLGQARAKLGLTLEGSDDVVEIEKISIVKQASAVLAEAKASHERITRLHDEGIMSQAEVDTTQAAYVVALNRYQDALEEARTRQALAAQRRAELNIARQQLEETSIKAPFDGAIQERFSTAGEYVTLGAPLLKLVQLTPLRLRVEVAEREAGRVRVGQEARVWVEGEAKPLIAPIHRINPALDERSRMLQVESDVPNPGWLHPGAFARAEILTREDHASVVVPPSALSVFAGIEKMFLIKDGKASEQQVGVGDRGLDWLEIVSGIKAGDRVVLNPGNLQTGQAVTVEESSK